MKKIRVATGMVSELANKFNTTATTVYAALGYYNNSDLAQKIRKKAKEWLIKEANQIEVKQ